MDEQRQDVHLEPTCSSSVPIQDVSLSFCRKQWTIGRCGERGSGIARHDDIYKYDQDIHMHKTFIMFIRIGIRKIRNWFTYEIFIYLLEFKVFRHEVRETQFLSMLTFPSDPTTCGTFRRLQLVSPRRAPKIVYLLLTSNLNSLVRSLNLN